MGVTPKLDKLHHWPPTRETMQLVTWKAHTHTHAAKRQVSLNLSTTVPTERASPPTSLCPHCKDGGKRQGGQKICEHERDHAF